MQENESNTQPKRRGRKPKTESTVEGLGDVIEKVTEVTGIKSVVEKFSELTGFDCGCEERKQKLNELFSFNKRKLPLKCMTEEHIKLWEKTRDITKHNHNRYIKEVYPVIATIHSELYDHQYHEPCTCSPRQWDNWRADIELAYKAYQEQN
jgi:hypothetical protein